MRTFRQKIIMVLWLAMTLFSTSAQGQGASLFDATKLHEIRVVSLDTTEVWSKIRRMNAPVSIIIDGHRLDSIGIRLKGATSAYSQQKPLEIDFNRFIKGQEYDKLKQINLRNNYQDSTLQRELLAYELYRRAGLPSPRSSYAEVYVDGVFRGIYTIVESIDKNFLKNNYGSNDGSLYKGRFDFKGFSVEVKEGTIEEFEEFEKYNTPLNLHEYVHLDQYLKQIAMDIITGDWDSYAFHRHNFYIYFETIAQRLHFINWDHNFAFKTDNEDKDVHPHGTFPSDVNLLEEEGLRAKYEQTLCTLLSYVADPIFLSEQVTLNEEVLSSSTQDFTFMPGLEILNYMAERTLQLKDTLKALNVKCPMPMPANIKDLVINEVAIQEDSRWIELHNSGSEPLTINNTYYLSNDPSFPKKWPFPAEVTLEPDAYLVIKDLSTREVAKLSTNFKIKKKTNLLYLTYEDLTSLQYVECPSIKKEQSYARQADGTFQLQDPTPNREN